MEVVEAGGTWIPALLVFVAVAAGTLALAIGAEWTAEWRRHGMAVRQLETERPEVKVQTAAADVLRAGKRSNASWAQLLVDHFGHLKEVGTLLEQAGLAWSVQRYIILVGGFALAGGLALLVLTRFLAMLLVGAALGAVMPYLYVRRKKAVRESAFEAQLPEAIELIGRAIRAGHPLTAGFQMVAHEMASPIAYEFRRVAEEQRYGLPIEESLMELTRRVELVDVRILVTAILIQREVGGNLAEILDNLAGVIRSRFTIRRQLRVYTAQGRISGYVLAAMPIILGMTIYSLNRDYMMVLLTEPVGKLMIGIAATMQIIGYLWIRKIVNIEI